MILEGQKNSWGSGRKCDPGFGKCEGSWNPKLGATTQQRVIYAMEERTCGGGLEGRVQMYAQHPKLDAQLELLEGKKGGKPSPS